MSIRTRLTCWYAAILFVSLVAMGTLTYRQFKPEPRSAPAQDGEVNGENDESDQSDLRESLRILFWCGVPSALLALGGGWWLMRQALSPVATLTQAASQITDQNLSARLPRTGNGDELDRLTGVFNAMIARLDTSFQHIREFTLHASHELKTPLTVIHGELETSLLETGLPAAERERLTSQLDEVQRLTQIVDALSLLTKADAGQVTLKRERLRLDELVRDACDDAQILALPRGIKVELAACEALELLGDRHRLRQLLLNLTDNAVKYNHDGGSVTLALRRDGAFAELTVANTGPGISPEALPRVFERFFRGDASHSHAVEGCGLGLSIAQWIVTAHGGSIQIQSPPGGPTRAMVRLPHA